MDFCTDYFTGCSSLSALMHINGFNREALLKQPKKQIASDKRPVRNVLSTKCLGRSSAFPNTKKLCPDKEA